MRKRNRGAAALLAIGILTGVTSASAGDVEVTVVTADGKKIKEGMLYASDQAVRIEGGGKVLVRNIAEQRTAVTADVRIAEGNIRYLGVTEGFPSRGKPAAVTVTVKPVKEIDAFCSGCHPSAGQPVKQGQIVRDIHSSGKEITGRHLEQVPKFAEYIERKRKEGKERPPEPIVLDERVVVVNGKEVKKYFYTCESCHTLHWKMPWRKYSRAAFQEKGTLCAGCHF